MRAVEVVLVVAAITAIGIWLLRKGARIAAEDRRRVSDSLRDLHGRWVRLGVAIGKGAIFPAEGWLDSRTIDQGYVELTADEPATFLLDDIRSATDENQSN